jgi:uncharacterized membrane protein YfcA
MTIMIGGLSFETIGVLWLGALLGGIAAGGSGFAFGLTASSIWLHQIDPLHSAILVTGCSVLLHMTTIWPQRKNVEVKRLWPFVAGGIIGIPIGVALLAHTEVNILKATLGAFLLVFGSYALFAPRPTATRAGGRTADATVGFAGGILGGLGGYSGVLPTVWTQVRGWPKEIARGVYQPYVILMQAITLASLILLTLDRRSLALLFAVLPPLLLGTWIGWRLYGKLNERHFRHALALLLIAAGATLVL